ncbi:alpha/beta hydrolase [Bacillaceae bacterium W0354]
MLYNENQRAKMGVEEVEKIIRLTNGKKLFVKDVPGEKETIIFVHGLTGNYKQLSYFQDALADGNRIIAYDLRGRGFSDEVSEDSSINRHVDDLLSLIETLKIVKPILIGYSMGAYICLKAASIIKNPKALILLDGAGETDEGQKDLILPSLGRLRKTYISREDYVEQTRASYAKLGINWDERMTDIAHYEIEEKDGAWTHKSNAEIMEKDFLSFYDFKHENYTKNLNIPTLLIAAKGKMGNRPLFYEHSYDLLKQLVPQLKIVTTEANHLTLVFNRQEDLETELKNFIQ